MSATLTVKERYALAALEKLAKRWPKSLGIFSDGRLHVIKLNESGDWPRCGMPGRADRFDQTAIVATIRGIKTDGGDPW